jgi:hypothetical protein
MEHPMLCPKGEIKMKKLLHALIVFTLLVSTASVSAKDIAGTTLPDTMKYGGKSMILNGAGVRKKFFLSLYSGGLYLIEKSSDAKKIISEDKPMAIRLVFISSLLSVDKMKKATMEGFEKSTGGKTAPIKPQIDQLMASFDKGVKTGDVYQLINMPGSGVHVVRNEVRVATIRSLPFKQALFGIWLSDRPVQASLKRSMLGK